MPAYRALPRFLRDYGRLTEAQQEAFAVAVTHFVADLRTGRFRPGLRVRGIQGTPGIYEMTWAPDGRATFEYGEPVRDGDVHVIWRRVGTHDVFRDP